MYIIIHFVIIYYYYMSDPMYVVPCHATKNEDSGYQRREECEVCVVDPSMQLVPEGTGGGGS